MAETFINVTEGSGKKLHTFDRTIGANSVHDEVVLLGHPYEATYVIPVITTSVATAASHVLQVMAGASLNVYIHSIQLWQIVSATTAGYVEFDLRRITTAGTGGTAVTAVPNDTTDAAAGASGMTLPTVKGTESGVTLDVMASMFIQTPGVATPAFRPVYEYVADGKLWKPIRIAAGAANGIAIKNVTAMAGASVAGRVILTEANF